MSTNNDYLDFNEVNTLARQAVDLLLPQAHLSIEETSRSNAYIYPQTTGGDHGSWRVTVTIAPGNSTVLGLIHAPHPPPRSATSSSSSVPLPPRVRRQGVPGVPRAPRTPPT